MAHDSLARSKCSFPFSLIPWQIPSQLNEHNDGYLFLQRRLYDIAGTCYILTALRSHKRTSWTAWIFSETVLFFTVYVPALCKPSVIQEKHNFLYLSCCSVDKVFFLRDTVPMTHTLQKVLQMGTPCSSEYICAHTETTCIPWLIRDD